MTGCQVIGNVYEKIVHHIKQDRNTSRAASMTEEEGFGSQLQQSQIGVAVECPILALLHHVVLEDRGSLGVVPIEAIENSIDMGRPGFTLVEGDHLAGAGNRW